jgi:hypothetical protein
MKITAVLLLTFALLAVFFIAGCDTNETLDGPITAIQFTPGATLTYEWIFETVASDFDGNVLETTTTTDTFAVHVQDRSEEIAGFRGAIQLDMYDTDLPDSRDAVWYMQSDSQLVEVAYRVGVAGTPVIHAKRDVLSFFQAHHWMEGRVASTPGEIRLREDPRIVVPFPLEVGAGWTSFTNPFVQVREAGGVEEVEVPAGSFASVVIDTRIAEEEGFQMVDHIAREGLIQREIIFEGEYHDRLNNITGTMVNTSRLRLIKRES